MNVTDLSLAEQAQYWRRRYMDASVACDDKDEAVEAAYMRGRADAFEQVKRSLDTWSKKR